MHKDIERALKNRTRAEWGYNFSNSELEEEYKRWLEVVKKGLARGERVTFIRVPDRRGKVNAIAYGLESEKDVSDSELTEVAEKLLINTSKVWREPSLELALIQGDGDKAKVSFPFRPDLQERRPAKK